MKFFPFSTTPHSIQWHKKLIINSFFVLHNYAVAIIQNSNSELSFKLSENLAEKMEHNRNIVQMKEHVEWEENKKNSVSLHFPYDGEFDLKILYLTRYWVT